MSEQPPIKKNKYGNVDLRQGEPAGLRHIPHKTYGTMGIRSMLWHQKVPCAPAFMGFTKQDDGPWATQQPWTPIIDGIVVRSSDYEAVMKMIETRRNEDRVKWARKQARLAKARMKSTTESNPDPQAGEP